MTLTLYNNASQANVVTKSLTQISQLTGTLRYSSSVLKPIITIESSTFINANYAHITEFGRYYYINDIVSEYNNLWTLSMEVDVLMTYATEIKAQTAIVSRQANKYNMYLDDGWFACYQNPQVSTKVFSEAAPFETQTFVLLVAGNSSSYTPSP